MVAEAFYEPLFIDDSLSRSRGRWLYSSTDYSFPPVPDPFCSFYSPQSLWRSLVLFQLSVFFLNPLHARLTERRFPCTDWSFFFLSGLSHASKAPAPLGSLLIRLHLPADRFPLFCSYVTPRPCSVRSTT